MNPSGQRQSLVNTTRGVKKDIERERDIESGREIQRGKREREKEKEREKKREEERRRERTGEKSRNRARDILIERRIGREKSQLAATAVVKLT